MVQDLRIDGQPLKLNQTYSMATGGGLIYALEFLHDKSFGLLPLAPVTDLGIENWKVLGEYMHSISPILPEQLTDRDRIRTIQADLGVSSDDIQMIPIRRELEGLMTRVQVRVRNYGATASPEGLGATVQLVLSQRGFGFDWTDQATPEIPEIFHTVGAPQEIPQLAPGASQTFEWTALLPEKLGVYGVTAQLLGVAQQVNHTNDTATRWNRLD
jgi:hypothetical protein